MLGTIDRDHVTRLIDQLAANDAAGIIAALKDIDEQFPDYSRLLDDLARLLQRIAVYQVVGSIDTEDDIEQGVLAGLAGALSPADVQLFYQTALIGRRDLHLAPDPKSGAEMTLLRMIAFRPADAGTGGTASGGASNTNEGKARAAKPVAKAVQAKATTAATRSWNDPDWRDLVPQLGLSGAERLLAGSCALLRRENNTVFFSLDSGSESYLTRQRKESLAQTLSDHFGEPLAIDISIGQAEVESPMKAENRQADEYFAAERAKLEADPNVQALKNMFGAELSAESIKLNNPTQGDEARSKE
jgi:DNA polymerase-3 subunit gamma/tau